MADTHPVERVRPDGEPALLFVCDHASNAVPPEIGDLGLPAADMARHIAWDVGARGVTLALSDAFDAPAVLSRFSRLVIDPNRGEDDPTLVMKLYDGTIIAGNRHADAAEVSRRLEHYHRPYHAAVAAALDRAVGTGATPAVIAIHSFTPQLRGRAPRPWHVTVLRNGDDRIADPLLARLRAEDELVVGDDEPYTGYLEGDTMARHGLARGLPHVLIELRNDLIADAEGQQAWAALLARCLADVLDLDLAEAAPDIPR
ncbi:N-formylglutamate amidohydrolase [Rubrimonas cliftonensis]|uniref:Predicted N-formylglutamate amidohydrolase n=1 Tax=Rubrimonas cliftonensis TaxID=89524 RepID=A0A1H4C2Q7_9RHOB|nr:N-formylglutamate amidohydrolase [Rubrimonas cliftonensis]SEA54634.1 Predicted N-formylglutamate amidohydrolase [Rubrimonas cliftonensis]